MFKTNQWSTRRRQPLHEGQERRQLSINSWSIQEVEIDRTWSVHGGAAAIISFWKLLGVIDALAWFAFELGWVSPSFRFQIRISRPSGKGTTHFLVGVQPIQDPSIVADRDEYASCNKAFLYAWTTGIRPFGDRAELYGWKLWWKGGTLPYLSGKPELPHSLDFD